MPMAVASTHKSLSPKTARAIPILHPRSSPAYGPRASSASLSGRGSRRPRQGPRQGIDPIEARHQTLADTAKVMTFDECAAAYLKAHEIAWHNVKHRRQWATTLATYTSPVFGALPVSAIVMRAIEPLWKSRPETGRRSVAGSNRFWLGLRSEVIGKAPIRHNGGITSTNCSRREQRSGLSCIWRRWTIGRFPRSWPGCARSTR
jgi:integrase-like protein